MAEDAAAGVLQAGGQAAQGAEGGPQALSAAAGAEGEGGDAADLFGAEARAL